MTNRMCGQCGVALPEGASARRRWCTAHCRKKAWRMRQRGPVKNCTSCHRQKSVEHFGKDRSRKDGLELRCRECRRERHAQSYVRKGHPESRPERWQHEPGDRFGSLVIVERLPRRNGTTWVLCKCDCGHLRKLALQNLASGATTHCGHRDHHPGPRHKGSDVTYDGAHNRLHRERGPARQHPCWGCGEQAEQWAYAHADHDQRAMAYGKEQGKPYSPDPSLYVPMCRSCHTRFDRAHKRQPEGLSLPHVALFLAAFADAEEVAE